MSPIPWGAILTHAPAIVESARRLFVTADANERRERNLTLDSRLNQLQKASLDSAQLLQDMAQQLQALANAQAETARRSWIATLLAIAATILGLGAVIFAAIS